MCFETFWHAGGWGQAKLATTRDKADTVHTALHAAADSIPGRRLRHWRELQPAARRPGVSRRLPQGVGSHARGDASAGQARRATGGDTVRALPPKPRRRRRRRRQAAPQSVPSTPAPPPPPRPCSSGPPPVRRSTATRSRRPASTRLSRRWAATPGSRRGSPSSRPVARESCVSRRVDAGTGRRRRRRWRRRRRRGPSRAPSRVLG